MNDVSLTEHAFMYGVCLVLAFAMVVLWVCVLFHERNKPKQSFENLLSSQGCHEAFYFILTTSKKLSQEERVKLMEMINLRAKERIMAGQFDFDDVKITGYRHLRPFLLGARKSDT